MDRYARNAIKLIQSYTPGTSIAEAKQNTGQCDVIKLASNENPLGPSPKAVQALTQTLDSLNRYPDPQCSLLKQRLAAYLQVSQLSLVVGNGSDEILVMALRAFVDPGQEVLVARPSFLIYELQAQVSGAQIKAVPLKDYRYDLKAMAQAVSPKTRVVFIANPDNPTGTYVTRAEFEVFLKALPAETLVVMDEAYYDFVDAPDYPQSIAYTQTHRVLVTRSFSKAYGLAGLRIGYGVAHADIIAALDAVREPFNVNTPAQAAAAAALEDTAYLAKTRELTRAGRTFLVKALETLGICTIPSQTNFILLKLGSDADASAVAGQLFERGVIVRDMHAWKLDGCLRVTIGTLAENQRFIEALKACMRRTE